MDELERELGVRLKAAAGKPPAEQRGEVLRALVTTLAKAYSLNPDELAILMISLDREMLRFVYPPELAKGGSNTFPVAVPSLAGRVAQTGESLLNNDMREVQHLAFYERIPIEGTEPVEIQKLLVVAVKGPDGHPQAVIEVSRRGVSLEEAGPDFRPEDQLLLERLAVAAAPAMRQAFAY